MPCDARDTHDPPPKAQRYVARSTQTTRRTLNQNQRASKPSKPRQASKQAAKATNETTAIIAIKIHPSIHPLDPSECRVYVLYCSSVGT
ncbi:uncharacterized protein K452DRAFT_284258 [Aplosporella prunicola CBS 121167]|uniref:Uncharacterized protein n=1 Tax=Aplosporella prunicola CBS 121167 TaxID=1176127 RepID=A0A6A6BL78_9PEZI|nr:uncharacterized protein K452DRAFT_284258 [Aplosporella prunicola CBS 121167]KAF2144872.1 hypothetical protein K452DRAFT_284258 [Aplosporella prunicola CBS 121167]